MPLPLLPTLTVNRQILLFGTEAWRDAIREKIGDGLPVDFQVAADIKTIPDQDSGVKLARFCAILLEIPSAASSQWNDTKEFIQLLKKRRDRDIYDNAVVILNCAADDAAIAHLESLQFEPGRRRSMDAFDRDLFNDEALRTADTHESRTARQLEDYWKETVGDPQNKVGNMLRSLALRAERDSRLIMLETMRQLIRQAARRDSPPLGSGADLADMNQANVRQAFRTALTSVWAYRHLSGDYGTNPCSLPTMANDFEDVNVQMHPDLLCGFLFFLCHSAYSSKDRLSKFIDRYIHRPELDEKGEFVQFGVCQNLMHHVPAFYVTDAWKRLGGAQIFTPDGSTMPDAESDWNGWTFVKLRVL